MVDANTGVVSKEMIEAWVQPTNKKEPCRIHSVAPEPWWELKENFLFWDGDCKDGYAFGIGREFATQGGELASWLVNYKEPGKPATYHLTTHYDRNYVEFKGAAPPRYVTLAYQMNETPTEGAFMTRKSMVDLSENRVYHQIHVAGTDEVRRVMVLPNQNSYITSLQADSVSTKNSWWTASNGQAVGYSVGAWKTESGVTARHAQSEPNQSVKEVRLPETYLRHLTDVDTQIQQNLGIADMLLRESFVVVNIYKRRVCQGQVSVDFVNPEIYGRICLENGELSQYDRLVADLNQQKEKRHIQIKEEYARQKTEAIARQQQAQTEQRTAEASRGQANNLGFGRALADFAGAMGNLHQQSSQFTQSFMNSQLKPQGGFSSPGGTTTTCVRVANVVNCR